MLPIGPVLGGVRDVLRSYFYATSTPPPRYHHASGRSYKDKLAPLRAPPLRMGGRTRLWLIPGTSTLWLRVEAWFEPCRSLVGAHASTMSSQSHAYTAPTPPPQQACFSIISPSFLHLFSIGISLPLTEKPDRPRELHPIPWHPRRQSSRGGRRRRAPATTPESLAPVYTWPCQMSRIKAGGLKVEG